MTIIKPSQSIVQELTIIRLHGLQAANPETRQRVARSGGRAVVASFGKEWMASIGRKGGRSISQNREHMRRIALLGVAKRRQRAEQRAKEALLNGEGSDKV